MEILKTDFSNRIVLNRRLSITLPASDSYADKVLGYGPIAYWQLNETSGTTAVCSVNSAQNGTHVGATLNNATGPDGVNGAPLLDGANDFTNIYSATLSGVFGRTAGSVSLWAKVFNAGVWTDAASRYLVRIRTVDGHYILVLKSSTNNRMTWAHDGGAYKSVLNNSMSTTDWMHIGLTWDNTADEMKAYLNGSQTGATQSGLGTITGALQNNATIIGALNTDPSSMFYGWLAHCALWDSVLTPAQVLDLATV